MLWRFICISVVRGECDTPQEIHMFSWAWCHCGVVCFGTGLPIAGGLSAAYWLEMDGYNLIATGFRYFVLRSGTNEIVGWSFSDGMPHWNVTLEKCLSFLWAPFGWVEAPCCDAEETVSASSSVFRSWETLVALLLTKCGDWCPFVTFSAVLESAGCLVAWNRRAKLCGPEFIKIRTYCQWGGYSTVYEYTVSSEAIFERLGRIFCVGVQAGGSSSEVDPKQRQAMRALKIQRLY